MIDNEDYRAERQKSNRELVCRIKADAEKNTTNTGMSFRLPAIRQPKERQESMKS